MSKKTLAAAVVMGVLASACTTYYQVTDPTTGKEYYTTKIDQMRSGSKEFVDANTGSTVTIQNAEVKEINKEAFRANTPK